MWNTLNIAAAKSPVDETNMVQCIYRTFTVFKLMVNLKSVIVRYEKHNHSVVSSTSDVILEKTETEKRKAQTTKEIEAQELVVKDLEDQLKNNNEKIKQIEANIAQKNAELYNHVKDTSTKSNGLGIFAALVPFVGPLVKSIFDAKTGSGVAAKIQVLSSELSQLSIEKSSLMNIEWNIHVRMTDMQLKLASMKIENGKILSLKGFTIMFNTIPDLHEKPQSDLS